MRVGIVAVAQTAFGVHRGLRPQELTYLAVKRCLEICGLPFRDGYEDIVTCSSDHWDGKTLSDVEHGEVAGAHLGPGEVKVSMDGANAVLLGAIKILSGHAECVLVTACCKETQVLDPSVIENFGFDAPYQQLVGLDFTQAAALQAVAYMSRHGLSHKDFAQVAVMERRRAKENPRLLAREDLSLEQVMESRMLAYPITVLESRAPCDGACAMVLACEERAKELTDRPVWIKGFGSCYDHHNLGDRDLSQPFALKEASRQAYEMAGIKDPAREIQIFELSEHYSYQLPLWMEGIGVCREGRGLEVLGGWEQSVLDPLAFNPSGGLLGGVPRYVAGANRVIEAFLQLRGEAEGVQVPGGPQMALAHGTHGPAGQHHCVLILERGF